MCESEEESLFLSMVDMRSERSPAPRTHTKISSVLCCVPSSPRARFQRRQQPISFASSRGSRSRAGAAGGAAASSAASPRASGGGLAELDALFPMQQPPVSANNPAGTKPSTDDDVDDELCRVDMERVSFGAQASQAHRGRKGEWTCEYPSRVAAECLARSKGCDSTSRHARTARHVALPHLRQDCRTSRRAPSTRRLARSPGRAQACARSRRW